MANHKHLDRLKWGVKAWNQWRQENPEIKPDLSGIYLYEKNLPSANLHNADLSDATLRGANPADANLRNANLKDANLSSADLSYADLRDANLNRTNLSFANLNRANLDGANLRFADLCNANLRVVQALRANLSAATLTGACIEDWNINSQTELQSVICDYVFTKYDVFSQNCPFTDRRPHDPNQIFAPGEFTKRYQIVLETVDLFFNDGIDWKAFLASLQDLQAQYGEELSIRDIGKRAGGTFLVQLEVPPDVDKGAIERTAWKRYEANLKQLEAQYRAELQDLKIQHGDEIITLYRQHNAKMEEITKLLASKPITVEAKAVIENQSSSETYHVYQQGATIANNAVKMEGNSSQHATQNIGATLGEITTLIGSLRNIAASFPEVQQTEAIEYLEDIETELKQPPEQRKLSRMKSTLLALVGVAAAVNGAVTSTNEFVGQVQELSEKLGVPLPIEQPQADPKAVDAPDL